VLRKCLAMHLIVLVTSICTRTESFDAMGEIGVDPRWEVFADLHLYLEKAFPAVYVVSLTIA